jgi:hypothetical protein
MRPLSISAPGSSSPDTTDRQIVLLGVLLTAIALTYFYAVDHLYFSTRRMAPIFRFLLMREDMKTAWLTLVVCLLAACWRKPAPILKLVDFLSAHEIAVAAAAVASFALGAIFIYHNNAFSMDEYAAVFQAKIFAAGRLTAQLPPSVIDWLIPPVFNGMFLVASHTTGQAMEGYWPGFSLILAPFEFLRAPWLCNASLAGIAIVLIHRITLEITADRRAAGWAVLFTLGSGTFAAYAISYYSMQAHLTANLLFVWLLLKPTSYRAFGAGVVGSLALVLHNPFPHTLFALPWIAAIAFSKERRPALLPLILGYLPLTILLGVGWLHLRGLVSGTDTGINVIGNTLGGYFGLPGKPMIDSCIAAVVKMWIWAVPGLFLFAGLGRLRRGDDWRVRLLAQSAVLTFVAYIFFIFDQGHGWGYRYFHSAWGVVPILAGCAMAGRPDSSGRLTAFAGAAAILNLLLVVPYQMTQIDGVIAAHSAQLPKPRRPGNDVYFVRVARDTFYLPDLIQMDPLLRTDDLILSSRGAELDSELRRQNWPAATLVESTPGVEEWGSPDPPSTPRLHFAITNPVVQ